MQKIGHSTSTATAAGEFTEGNAGGVPATLLKAAWLNAVQRELVNLIGGAGIELDAEDNAQVLKAVQVLISGKADRALLDWISLVGLMSNNVSLPFMRRASDNSDVYLWADTNAKEKLQGLHISTPAADAADGLIATLAFVRRAIAGLVNSSPAALDTLQELAAALGNDPNFATTMLNALAGKADRGQLDWISGVGLEADNPAFPYVRQAATNAMVYLATREAVDSKLGQGQFDRMMRAGLGSGELSQPYMMRDDGQIAWLWGDTNAAGKLTAVQISTPAADAADGLIANLAFVRRAIATLVNSSPAALDTLQELAAALGNDPNFATTMLNALAGKADRGQLDHLGLVGLMSADLTLPFMRRASDGADVYLWADTNGHGRVAGAIATQAVGTLGTYALLLVGGGTTLVPVEPGSIVSGSNCRFSSTVGDSGSGAIGPAPVGSWMVMGYLQDANLNDANSVTLCKRVA